jgi:hypothetical protein
MCDVSKYITWTLKATQEYGCLYYDAYIMIMHLKELFSEASMTKMNETSKKLFCCKMTEGFSVNTHVLKIIGYIEKVCQ